jgi:hypothetical protein
MSITIQIKPDRFIASSGKLDSNFRYVRRSSSPLFFLAKGRTMDVSGGGARYVSPSKATSMQDSSYTGAFLGGGSTGVAI